MVYSSVHITSNPVLPYKGMIPLHLYHCDMFGGQLYWRYPMPECVDHALLRYN